MNRTGFILTAIVGLIVLTLGLVLHRSDGRADLPVATTPLAKLPTTTDSRAADVPESTSKETRIPTTVRSSASIAPFHQRRFIVRGRIQGPLGDALSPLIVQVLAENRSDTKPVQLGTPVDPAMADYEIAALEDVVDAWLSDRTFRVELREGNRALESVVLQKPDASKDPAVGSTGDIVIQKDLTFDPPSIITGLIVDPKHAPVKNAKISLLTGGVPKNLTWEPAARDFTSESGSFRLRIRDVSDGTLLISHPDFEVQSMTVRLPDRGTLELGTIGLRSGLEISGVVRCTIPIFPLEGIQVIAYPALQRQIGYVQDGFFVVDGQPIQTMENQFVRERILTTCDASGSFAIRGLRQGPHGLHWAGGSPVRADTARGDADLRLVVDAPASGIAIEINNPLIVTTVTQAGKPAAGMRVSVGRATGELHRMQTNSSGNSYFFANENERIYVAATYRGFGRAVCEVTAPPRGRVTYVQLELHPVGSPASLILEVADSSGRPIPRVACAIIPASSVLDAEAWVQYANRDDGKFEFKEIEPGRYHVEVRSLFWHESDRPLVPARFNVTLEPKSVIRRNVVLEDGCQILLSTDDLNTGHVVRARCALLNEKGDRVVEKCHYPEINWMGDAANPPPVPAGTYTVVAEHPDYETAKATVTVEKGRRALANLKMRRK